MRKMYITWFRQRKTIGPQCVLGVLCLVLFLSVGMLFSNISIWELNFNPLCSRHGALVDERRFLALFQLLDFDVDVKQDLTVDHIRLTAPEFAAKDHSQFDAFVFFIPLYGGSNA